MAKIGIDARFYGSIGKGLGRYTQKLIEHLEIVENQSGDRNTYYIFLCKENFDEYQPKNENFKKVLADFGWYSFSEQVRFPLLLAKCKLDLVHFPHFNIPVFYFGKFVVTVHDLILIHHPTIRATTLNPVFYWLKFLAYKLVINRAIRASSNVVTVSEFTKKDIQKEYGIDEDKIIVTHEACDYSTKKSLASVEKNNILRKFQLTKNGFLNKKNRCQSQDKCGIIKTYLLYVGNAYPHKNLERLVKVFNRIDDNDLYLVLVGKQDYFYKQLKEYARNLKCKNLILTGFVSDEELSVIYENASVYIFPSLYEGFGLPPLEAMAQKVPVISSDRASLPEILGDAAHYFNPESEDEIIEAINSLIYNDSAKNKLIDKGLKQVNKFNWLDMAQKTHEIYKKNLSSNG